MVKVIIVTGTPGTGKTVIAKKIAKEKNYLYVDVNKAISEKKIATSYDKKRKCKVVDVERLNKVLIGIIKKSKKGIVIDSHLSHYLPKQYVDECIVTKCGLKELKKRLRKRHYSKEKLEENMEAEIMDVCLNEAKEKGHKIKVVDTSKDL